MKQIVTVLLLAGVLAVGLAQTVPGNNYSYYDDGTRHHKVCYNLTEQGWGVRFCPNPGEWVKITDVEVNLCPPEIDGPYTGRIVIYGDDGTGAPDINNVLWTGTHEIRIGEWWHYIQLNTPVWTDECFYVFHVVDATCQYPQYCYQWFDGTNNAPSGTQWYRSKAGVFTPDNTAGDIEIRARFEAHDVAAISIETPTSPHYWGQPFTPTAYVKNVGLYAETDVPVNFSIAGTSYNKQVIIDEFPANGTPILVTFPTATWVWGTGAFTMTCEVDMTHDWDPTNDVVTEDLVVDLKDVACDLINSPTGIVLQGASVPCNGQIYNYGTTTETFHTDFTIINSFGAVVHTASAWVYNLAPGTDVPVAYGNWTAGAAGYYTAQCSTKLVGDAVPANDEADERFVVSASLIDAGAIALLSPPNPCQRNTSYPLNVEFKNYGSASATFPVRCSLIRPDGTIAGRYTKTVTALGSGLTETVTFATRRFNKLGTWKVVTWSNLTGDQNAGNDTFITTFVSVTRRGWQLAEMVPTGMAVNKGAALTGDGVSKFFLLKGKNSPVLYTFSDDLDAPAASGSIPQNQVKIGAGTSIAYANGLVYLLKANKSLEFYSFNPATGEWIRLADMPAGLRSKPARNGSRLVAADGKLYMLKGNKTNEFYCYDPATGAWTTLAEMPAVGSGKPVGDGAALCSYNGRLFAFKGNRTTEFYTYDIASNGWQRLADVPNKAKAGACLTFENGTMYATVGGNKMEFYSYNVLTNQWTRNEDVLLLPDNKKVKDGAAMTSIEGAVMFLKGKKAQFILAYETDDEVGAGRQPEQGVQAAPSQSPTTVFVSSPVSTIARLSYSFSAPAHIQLYNSSGALVRTVTGGRNGAQFSVAGLSNGTYVLRIAAGSTTVTRQLVIER